MRLLVVEDHVSLADELLEGLNRQGYACLLYTSDAADE